MVDLGQTEVFHVSLFSFRWKGEASAIENQFSNPDDASFDGYSLTFEFENQDELSFEEITNRSTSLEIVPPSAVTKITSRQVYDASSPFCNCDPFDIENRSDGSTFAFDTSGDDFALSLRAGGSLQIGLGGESLENLPEGWWLLKKDGVELASYDFGQASPIGPGNKPRVYVPSIKAVIAADQSVDHFEIKWYLYNFDAGTYEEITDLTTFAEVVEHVGACLDDSDGTVGNGNLMYEEGVDFDSITQTSFAPESKWYFYGHASTTDYVMFSFRFNYRVYGTDFVIEIRNW